MENLIIMMLPPEIQAGIKIGDLILNGGTILDTQNNNSAAFINEEASQQIISPAALGINPAMAALSLAVVAGFMVVNSKLDKIQEQLTDIKSDLSEIKRIVSDSQEYEIGKLFADFRTWVHEAKLNVVENKAENLSNLRREFLKIGNRVKVLANMIQDKEKIIILRDTFMQYIKLYYACAEFSIRCSAAGNEFNAARQLVADSAENLSTFQKNYYNSFANASAYDIANISYISIPDLKKNYFQIKFMRDCIKSNDEIITGIEQKKFTYIEFDKKMNELHEIKQPAMLMIK